MGIHRVIGSLAPSPHAAPLGHVVVVEDEQDLAELLCLRLEHHGFRATAEPTIRGAIEVMEREVVDTMIVDIFLDGESGLDLLESAQQRSLDVPMIVLSAHGSVQTAVDAMARGAYAFLVKPFHDHELLEKVSHAVERRRLRSQIAGLRRIVHGDQLLGGSAKIAMVRERIARVAPSDATVLVLGESGTGKELASQMLHALSPRAAGPFLAMNCGALPEPLLESELFGHVRGAFTDAVQDRKGLFASAAGGTVLLDEIGDAPLSVQVKLLRVLQEREVVPIGAARPVCVDVRVVAATHRDLRAEVRAGRFREDLFYRLHVVPVPMPPLRDRKEDVPVLAEFFLARVATRHGLAGAQLSTEGLRELIAHDWPGNVRELANVVESALLLAADGVVRAAHIRAVIVARPRAQKGGDPREVDEIVDAALPTLREARERFDRAYVEEVLRRAEGNVSAAARIAGRNRTDFHALLQRHGVSGSHFRKTASAPRRERAGRMGH